MLRLGMPKAIYYLNLFTQSKRNLDNFEVKEKTFKMDSNKWMFEYAKRDYLNS